MHRLYESPVNILVGLVNSVSLETQDEMRRSQWVPVSIGMFSEKSFLHFFNAGFNLPIVRVASNTDGLGSSTRRSNWRNRSCSPSTWIILQRRQRKKKPSKWRRRELLGRGRVFFAWIGAWPSIPSMFSIICDALWVGQGLWCDSETNITSTWGPQRLLLSFKGQTPWMSVESPLVSTYLFENLGFTGTATTIRWPIVGNQVLGSSPIPVSTIACGLKAA